MEIGSSQMLAPIGSFRSFLISLLWYLMTLARFMSGSLETKGKLDSIRVHYTTCFALLPLLLIGVQRCGSPAVSLNICSSSGWWSETGALHVTEYWVGACKLILAAYTVTLQTSPLCIAFSTTASLGMYGRRWRRNVAFSRRDSGLQYFLNWKAYPLARFKRRYFFYVGKQLFTRCGLRGTRGSIIPATHLLTGKLLRLSSS